MYIIKDAENARRIAFAGQTGIIDAGARFTYCYTATCTVCGGEAFVTRYERLGPSPGRAIFKCSSCFSQFEMGVDHISLT